MTMTPSFWHALDTPIPHMNRNEFVEDLLHGTAGLPEEERIEALGVCFASALKLMDRGTILELRAQIATRRGQDPALRSVINLIDGHLILREIQAATQSSFVFSAVRTS